MKTEIDLSRATVSQTCSWCHELNQLRPGCAVYCHNCGHRADVPRIECRCLPCLFQRMLIAASQEVS